MAKPVVSVLFPTIRRGQFRRSFDSIREAAGVVPYEVIVVSDFGAGALECHDPWSHLRCVWLERERRGPIAAIEEAFRASRGDFVFVFNDESTLAPMALEILYDVAVAKPWVLYSPRHLPDFNFVYYGRPFAAFPFAHRALVNHLGGLFDPAFKGFYADPDLSMRAHAAGIPIRVVEEAVLRHSNCMTAPGHMENVSEYLEGDQKLFRSRWDHLGVFADP